MAVSSGPAQRFIQHVRWLRNPKLPMQMLCQISKFRLSFYHHRIIYKMCINSSKRYAWQKWQRTFESEFQMFAKFTKRQAGSQRLIVSVVVLFLFLFLFTFLFAIQKRAFHCFNRFNLSLYLIACGRCKILVCIGADNLLNHNCWQTIREIWMTFPSSLLPKNVCIDFDCITMIFPLN